MARDSISRRRQPLSPFTKHPRFQEGTRKLIVCLLLREARDCERRAAQARKLAARMPTPEALHDRSLLCDVVNFEGYFIRRIAGLFGLECPDGSYAEQRAFLIDKLLGIESQAAPIAASKPTQEKDPVAAAQRIIAEARRAGEFDAIDWTQNPKDEREVKLRAAILRAIKKKFGARPITGEPWWIWAEKLRQLAPRDSKCLGEDLYDEIERAKRLIKEADANELRDEHRKLMELAQREIDGGETP
jgi:hypothetical protein